MLRSKECILTVLRGCPTLGDLSERQRIGLSAFASFRDFEGGDWLCRQRDAGNEMFVLVEGELEVILEDEGAESVILARLDEFGDAVGEQAVREQGGRRSASVRATTAAQVLVLPGPSFRTVMGDCDALADHLDDRGKKQAEAQRLARRSVLYAVIAATDHGEEMSQELHFAQDAIVFDEADEADAVYIVRTGEAEISRRLDGERKVLGVIGEGQTFGELGVSEVAPRSSRVTAKTDLRLCALPRSSFLEAASSSSELRDYLSTLRAVYSLPSFGVAAQFAGTLDGGAAVVTVFTMEGHGRAITHHALEKQLYHGVSDSPRTGSEVVVVFEDPMRNLRRELHLSDGVPIEVYAHGPWDELHAVHEAMLRREVILTERLEGFAADGVLHGTRRAVSVEADPVVCHCLGIRRSAIDVAVKSGVSNVEALAESTGASTVCGGCVGSLSRLVGGATGYPVRLHRKTLQYRDVHSFVFTPKEPGTAVLRKPKPGQHVLVSARINGNWVSRPYTLSSSALSPRLREVTVKTELHGYFSRWLAKNAENDPEIKLSQPRGDFWVDLEDDRPVVCFVAGIGMTPAVAIARTLVDGGNEHILHIDYSAPLAGYFAHRTELERLADENANISLNLRVTGAGQRIRAGDVAACVKRIPGARFFLCGPRGYQHAVQNYLLDAGVETESIRVETFTPVGRRIEKEDLAPRRRKDVAVVTLGLALLLAYLAQAALGVYWPWLEALQADESYRRWSGALVAAYILAQWTLAARRAQGASAKVTGRSISRHRALGAVAPLVFYAHATHFGYAMLFALSVAYLGNAVVGLFDKTWLKGQAARARYHRRWLPIHIAISCLLVGLALVHLWVVFAYQGGVAL